MGYEKTQWGGILRVGLFGIEQRDSKRTMDAEMYSRMWQTPNLYSTYKYPALMQLQANNNEFHSWFHSRKPSMDDVGNPTSVNAR